MTRSPSNLPPLAAALKSFDPARHRLIARSSQGQLLEVNAREGRFVVKMPVGRRLAGMLWRHALRREHTAYRQLQGLPGFPRCHGLFDDRHLVIERIAGVPLRQATLLQRERFFANLQATITAMHQRGIAHGDLKNRDNIMVRADDQHPFIIDLGTAVVRKPGLHPFNHRLFDYLCRIDRNAWIKLKYGGYDRVQPADRAWLRRSLIERINSRLRRGRRRVQSRSC
ncbi:MAG: hypothetical protein HND55_03075 [Pseudomonadota bacterium]|nr:MAG: hypothetical protein HND55_03075 [Pseudomonadota bacterium]